MNKQKMNDEALVNRYIQGDEQCLEILLNRHQERIFRTVVIYCNYNRTRAEDIFQEALFKAVRALKEGNYTHQNYFASWIETIAKNLVIDEHRKTKNYRLVAAVRNSEGEYTDIFDIVKIKDEKLQEEQMIQRDEYKLKRGRMRAAIHQLPVKLRNIVVMRYYFKMSFAEISEMLDINLNTALGRMRNASIKLREMIDEEGAEISANGAQKKIAG